jgi:hypothetical protein
MLLSKFSNEVLSRGPGAILPQNLDHFWLKTIQKLCDDFLDRNFAVDQCTSTLDTGDPVLVACVHEALRHSQGQGIEISSDELAEDVTIYALSVTMETIRRESDIQMPLPTMQDLLSIDRIVQFGKINSKFGRFLERACIISENEKQGEENWFQRLKKKILSRISNS